MRVPSWIIPVLIVAIATISLTGARLLAFPSVVVDSRPEVPGSSSRTSVFLVNGVRCVDTAEQAAEAVRDVEGVLRFVAYASRNRVDITYDPEVCSIDRIRDALERPVWDDAAGSFIFGLFRVVEIDGREIQP